MLEESRKAALQAHWLVRVHKKSAAELADWVGPYIVAEGVTTIEGIRLVFLRAALDCLDRRDSQLLGRLEARLPDRLQRVLEHAKEREGLPSELLPLDDGEELLLALDSLAGDTSLIDRDGTESHSAGGQPRGGGGRLLEQVGNELATRALLIHGSAVIRGDLAATLARLQNILERPFSGVNVPIVIERTENGMTLDLQPEGRPRAARILRPLAIGAIRAALRFCREAPESEIRFFGETLGDRAHLEVRFRGQLTPTNGVLVPETGSVSTGKRPSRIPKPPPQPLTREVERIIGRTTCSKPPPLPHRQPCVHPLAGLGAASRLKKTGQ